MINLKERFPMNLGLAVKIGTLVGGLVTVILLTFVIAFPVMWLWNWIVVGVFALPHLGYIQACGLYLLIIILFKTSVTKKD